MLRVEAISLFVPDADLKSLYAYTQQQTQIELASVRPGERATFKILSASYPLDSCLLSKMEVMLCGGREEKEVIFPVIRLWYSDRAIEQLIPTQTVQLIELLLEILTEKGLAAQAFRQRQGEHVTYVTIGKRPEYSAIACMLGNRTVDRNEQEIPRLSRDDIGMNIKSIDIFPMVTGDDLSTFTENFSGIKTYVPLFIAALHNLYGQEIPPKKLYFPPQPPKKRLI